jgi:hypothetical protein
MPDPNAKHKKASALAREAREDLEERAHLPVHPHELRRKLSEDRSRSPQLSGGDIDADWDDADRDGDETVGGTAPTPDQDVVDELGQAVGLTYNDDEPLNSEEKLRQRDRHRWELNPASSRDLAEDALAPEDDAEIPDPEFDEDDT